MKIFAIFGKSATGKDTILRNVEGMLGDAVHPIVSTTTRPARDYEVEGKDYYFVQHDDFTRKVLDMSMVEALQFNGWWYGTEKRALSPDKVNIGIYTIDGIFQLIEDPNIEVQAAFIDVDDKVRLIRALERESSPNIKEIIRRYSTDEADFSSDNVKELADEIPVQTYVNDLPVKSNVIAYMIGQRILDWK